MESHSSLSISTGSLRHEAADLRHGIASCKPRVSPQGKEQFPLERSQCSKLANRLNASQKILLSVANSRLVSCHEVIFAYLFTRVVVSGCS